MLRQAGLGSSRDHHPNNQEDDKLLQVFKNWRNQYTAHRDTGPLEAAATGHTVEQSKREASPKAQPQKEPVAPVTPTFNAKAKKVPTPAHPTPQTEEDVGAACMKELLTGVSWLENCRRTHTHVSWPLAMSCLEHSREVQDLGLLVEGLLDEYYDKFMKYFRAQVTTIKGILCFLMSLSETSMDEKNGLRAIGEHACALLPCDVCESNAVFDEDMFGVPADPTRKVGDGVFTPWELRKESKWYWLVTDCTDDSYPLPRQKSTRAENRRYACLYAWMYASLMLTLCFPPQVED
jgi:hypothetical protein